VFLEPQVVNRTQTPNSTIGLTITTHHRSVRSIELKTGVMESPPPQS
jgi:hypothetical protein